MAISFHVIVAPDTEALGCMSFLLPEEGGSIGRGASNSFMLPDETETISSVHALVRKENSEYILEDISQSGVVINGAENPVGYQNEALIRDGDLLDIGGYRLLVSCFDPQLSEAKPLEKPLNGKVEDPFKHKLDVRDRPVIDRSDLQSYSDPFMQLDDEDNVSGSIGNEQQQEEGVNEPANDVDHQVQVDPFIKPNKHTVSNKSKEDISLNFDEISPDPFKSQVQTSEFVFQENERHQEAHVTHSDAIQLNKEEIGASFISENQVLSFPPLTENKIGYLQSAGYTSSLQAINNEQLKVQIEQALARFIDDLSPNALEHLFNHYQSGLFKVKKKDMWMLYNNYFNRMAKSEEFNAKFWAYFYDS
ncbi:FHA domain-containing protein [uncultured Shewanella sp.]|uniref:type VI secretion system-associated FHA domain protein n=1 Tax=uncultured Shewanella sp. TaxID=173975 RepID=UPI00261F8C20|nr:FHA domain-containing protein [uncultured Shewanella sp.]